MLALIPAAYTLNALRRQREAKQLSDALCRRLACKALPVRLWSGSARLILERPRFYGVMQISPGGHRASFQGLTRHAYPVVGLISPGVESALLRLGPVPRVSLSDSSFQQHFEVYAQSEAVAETAFPAALRAAIERFVTTLGWKPESLPLKAIEAAVVELLESESERRKRVARPKNSLQLGGGGNCFWLDMSSETRLAPDFVPQVVALIDAFAAATSRLEHVFHRDTCRFCCDLKDQTPKRSCERCGARYHEECFRFLRRCPVWGCGDALEQIQAHCAAHAWQGPMDLYRWWLLHAPRRELPEAPKD
ncbi:hypothetical protein WMF37_21415 [Sorangium sp. So ce291]|uniref:hypothetical protein n=1 Tax=Sorangium sp. So ce291 TaxID=3133294 RepID=UPI003F62B773